MVEILGHSITLDAINDGMLHEFVLTKGRLVIQANFYKHFEGIAKTSGHGYLLVDNGKLVDDGSTLVQGELEKFQGGIMFV